MHRLAESHLHVVGIGQRRGLATDDQHARQRPAQGSGHLQNFPRVHAVHLDRASRRFARPRTGGVGLDHVQRARHAALRSGVHQDRQLVGLEQGIGQVEAANAEIHDPHSLGPGLDRQPPRRFDAKCIVAEEDVADAGH